ncbi:hypothetical protein APHAL10511_007039 [Amanita phalloides]|nr:hypothetical protein APHAL10511_007039 [Amanita phalloides]
MGPSVLDTPWTKSPNEITSYFNVDANAGLSADQVARHAEQYGKNELPEEPPTPLWELILEQFKDQLVLILLASAVISFILALFEDAEGASWGGAFVEPLVILLILVANATVGVVQESSAEQAIDALKEYSPDEAKAIRSGQLKRIHATEIVPGDIISVAVGDKVPADCRLLSISSSSFRVDQAILTGESISVNKSVDVVTDVKAVKQDMTNMLFSGTTIVNGNAKAVVVFTGEKTAIGDIHKSITTQISEKTPLKRKLDDFGDMLAKVISVICILVWLVNIRHFWDPAHHGALKGAIYYFKIAVALAVAAIPEGLAAVITACLALGTKKMAQKNAIVRNLPSVETLGCTNVICSDKTGTLTTNQMSISRFSVVSATGVQEYVVEGTTYAPDGLVKSAGGHDASADLRSDPIQRLAEISALCNDAKIVYHPDKQSYSNVGEPTEAALKVLVEKIGCRDQKLMQSLSSASPDVRVNAVNDYIERSIPRLLTFEFTRDRKMMSVLVRLNGTGALFVKGAPESVLDRCTSVQVNGKSLPLTADLRTTLLDRMSAYGSQGLRTLALAYVNVQEIDATRYLSDSTKDYLRFEQDLTFVGLVGMLDPPRPEVREAVATCKAAGIRVICITGDNKGTAETICRQIGIFAESEVLTGKSYTGKELDALSYDEKIAAVQRASLFSRTEPGHKSQLVDLLQSLGQVVAMTGDGVNDAPALKKADIGVAMGSGTDVAKLAADMVLADSNFATIEKAVEEGRLIYNNTKQFIRYLISSNIGEVVSIFLTVILGMPEALIPVQLLWVNLVTDSLPATALGFNPADHSIMRVPPRNSREPLVGKWLFIRYLLVGFYVGCATVYGYAWWFMYYTGGPQISFYQLTHFHQCHAKFSEIGCEMFTNAMAKRATTMSLSILVTVEMFNAMNSLSENESLITLPVWANPYLVAAVALSMALHFMILYVPFFTKLFAIMPLNWTEWQAVLYLSAPVLLLDELLKYITANLAATENLRELSIEDKAKGRIKWVYIDYVSDSGNICCDPVFFISASPKSFFLYSVPLNCRIYPRKINEMRLDVLTIMTALSLTLMGRAHEIGRRHHWRRHPKVESTSNSTVLEKRFEDAKFTFYDAGEGACGRSFTDQDFVVAINPMQYAGGVLCFQTITITANGKTTTAQIVDQCMGCPFAGLDLSRGLFEYFASSSMGKIYGTWVLGDDTSPSPTTTYVIPSTTWSPSHTQRKTKSSTSLSSSSTVPGSTVLSSSSSSTSSAAATPTPATTTVPGVIGNLELVFAQLGGLVVQAPNVQ